MRKFSPIFIVLIALSCRKSGVSGYPEEGPFYQMPYMVDGPAAQVTQVWMAAGSDQSTSKHNFVAPISFQDSTAGGAGSQGQVTFGQPFRLLDDLSSAWTRVVQVRGTGLLVQIQDDYKRQVTVSVLDRAGGHRQLASFVHAGQNTEDGASALSRSGRNALVVAPDKISLWDIVNWHEEKVDGSNDLLAIRSALMKATGNPGNWWLTDDLRYIIVDSTHRQWGAEGDEDGVDAKPFDLGKFKLDAAKDAVVFDRKSGTFSVFESHIPSSVPGTFAITDVESVGGQISLLYTLNIDDLRVAIADLQGHVRASHTVNSYVARLAGWDPEHDEVWIQTRDATINIPSGQPDADHHLILWNAAKDTERRFRVTVEQMRKAVENAK